MMQQPSILSSQISRSFEEHHHPSSNLWNREVDAARALLSLSPALRESNHHHHHLPKVLYREPPQYHHHHQHRFPLSSLATTTTASSSSTMLPVASSHNISFHDHFRESPVTVMSTTMRIPSMQAIPPYSNFPFASIHNNIPRTIPTTTVKEELHGNSSVMISCGEVSSSSDNSVASHHSEAIRTTITKKKQKKNNKPTQVSSAGEEFPDVHENTPFYDGSTSLALPEDEESLSPLHCFMRKYCVQVFTATAEDVATPRYGKTHGRHIVAGQVGLQCVHCKHRPYESRQERAVCFPSSLKNIYHSIETWQRRHSLVCEDIPAWAKTTMTELMNKSRSGAGGRRQYWEESARRIGMVDTPTGIRFIRPPGEIAPAKDPVIIAPANIALNHNNSKQPSRPLVFENDRPLVTDYLYLLLEQMETCQFTEQDRVGGRSKVKDCPIGYPGLQCKHCTGKAGFGRYFPASEAALTSANSDRNIYNHVSKCRKCPAHVREQLQQFSQEQNHYKNRRGSRKIFFQRIWGRMHGTTTNTHYDS